MMGVSLGMMLLALATGSAQQQSDAHRAAARDLAARSGFSVTYELQCREAGGLPAALFTPGAPPATRLFDNFFYVGLNGVGAYVLRTGDGLILIDTLNSTKDAQTIIVPGMEALGLNPHDLRYILISHGHGDHYGGAAWLAKTYGARVMASEADWTLMERAGSRGGGRFDPPPARDLVASDGEILKLGDTSIRIVATPGHTPGTLSFLIPVTDKGVPHMLGMLGGTGIPAEAAARADYVRSLDKFADAAFAAGADVELSNHPFVDDSLARMAKLRSAPDAPNPFIIGEQRYADYAAIQKHCALARDGGTAAAAK
ncbi:MBL fold metallo-hydrolase [uncultured Sphingopyxis sp.]|jgi:metallo-beta-lactamase class B|uniref:MBL fold metallo-hydrolase n=1 Tax=uncultured Sphingopyxis sp. TaxID=310581 RepID=UPI000A8C30EF|nr:MBL fold metallo-hydrolase [uncultured Sphingopyxis sp.]